MNDKGHSLLSGTAESSPCRRVLPLGDSNRVASEDDDGVVHGPRQARSTE